MSEEKQLEGFHVICGTTPKNGTIFGGSEDNEHPLDLTGLNSLLIADLDYFVENHEDILELVKKQIKLRDADCPIPINVIAIYKGE